MKLFNPSILSIIFTITISSCGTETSNPQAGSNSVSQESSTAMTDATNGSDGTANPNQRSETLDQSSVAITKIVDVVANAKEWEGKEVAIKGEITKVNSRIMGRNWIHIKDGSKDDYDLVVTSKEIMNVGDLVTLTCRVTLNKDFGAGYKYDLILEDGKKVN